MGSTFATTGVPNVSSLSAKEWFIPSKSLRKNIFYNSSYISFFKCANLFLITNFNDNDDSDKIGNFKTVVICKNASKKW